MKKLMSIVAIVAMLCLALPVSAMTFVTENGIYKGTPEEIAAVIQGDFQGGAITFKEGQKDVSVSPFLPSANNDKDLGSYNYSFKDVHASGTLYVGKIKATSSADSLIAGQKICLANGTNCAGVDSSALWTYDNNIPGWYRASTTPEKLGLGDSTPGAFLEIDGDQDIIQFLVQGHSTQTNDLIQGMNNAGASVFGVTNAGNVAASGTLAITGASTLTGAATLSSTLGVTGIATFAGALKASSTFQSTGAVILYSTATITGAATLSDTLSVTGATTLTGAATLSSTLAVTGATTLTGLLTPNGGVATSTWNATTIGLSTAAAAQFTTVTMTGAATLSSTLAVTGATTLTGLLTPNGGIATSTWNGTTIGLGTAAAAKFTTVVTTGGASVSSTFSSGVAVTEASTTSTLYVGGAGAQGQGGCLYLASGDGSGGLYLFVSKTTLQLTTSTSANACF